MDKPDGYKGFLCLRCERCGKECAFNIKTPSKDYVCGKCGGVMQLHSLRRPRFHLIGAGGKLAHGSQAESVLIEHLQALRKEPINTP